MNSSEHQLLRARMNVVAQEAISEWLAESYKLLVSLCAPELQARALTTIKEKLEAARSEYSGISFPELEKEQSNLQASLFREAFDAAAQKVEKSLGLLS